MHPDAVGGLGLKVRCRPQHQLILSDFKGPVIGATGASDQKIGEGLGGKGAIGIGAGQGTHHTASSDVFIDAGGAQANVGGGFINVVNGDSHHLVKEGPTLVGGTHPNAEVIFDLKVRATVNPQLVTEDVEGAVVSTAGAGDQAVGKGVTAILVGGAEITNDGIRRHVLIDAGGAEAEVRGGVIDIIHPNG